MAAAPVPTSGVVPAISEAVVAISEVERPVRISGAAATLAVARGLISEVVAAASQADDSITGVEREPRSAPGSRGLAAGAIIGGALANPGYDYDPGYDAGYDVAPAPDGDDAVAYCQARFRSYDPDSGTYLGTDGLRHPCP